ncbi:MAG: FAD binding domain-containing protein [Burkholderiaceae bacterium]
MKLPGFAYARPTSIEAALALLADDTQESKVLAGGQSLLAAMNFRLSSPQRLIDINRIAALTGISLDAGMVRIGALTRHVEIARSDLVARELPLLAHAIAHVAHPAIRNRGTFGGSLALADPAAEMPAVALASDATLIARSLHGERRIAVADYFLGLYETALVADELLIAAEFPAAGDEPAGWAFAEQARRHGDFANAGVIIRRAGGQNGTRVVLFGVSDRPVRSTAAEAALGAGELDDDRINQAAGCVCDGIDIFGDQHASDTMKRHLCGVLIRRALRELAHGVPA